MLDTKRTVVTEVHDVYAKFKIHKQILVNTTGYVK